MVLLIAPIAIFGLFNFQAHEKAGSVLSNTTNIYSEITLIENEEVARTKRIDLKVNPGKKYEFNEFAYINSEGIDRNNLGIKILKVLPKSASDLISASIYVDPKGGSLQHIPLNLILKPYRELKAPQEDELNMSIFFRVDF